MADRNEPPDTRRAPPKPLPRTVEVMGARLSHPGEEPTRPDVPLARERARRLTLTASPAPPPPRPAPELPQAERTPVSARVQSLPPAVAPRAPQRPVQVETLDTLKGIGPASQGPLSAGRDLVANPYDSEDTRRRARAELARHGDRLHDAPQSQATRVVVDQPWYRTAKGMGIVIPIIVTGLGGTTVGVVLPVIKAIREPYEGAKVKDIAEAKAASERAEKATEFERLARQGADTDLAKADADLGKHVAELRERLPAVKPNPNRPPKSE